MKLNAMTAVLQFALLLAVDLSLTAAAPRVPDGRYYDQFGFQDAFLVVKNGRVSSGSCARGCPDFSRYKVVAYSPSSKAILVDTPVAKNLEYCSELTIPRNRLRTANQVSTSSRMPVYARCGFRHGGWQLVF